MQTTPNTPIPPPIQAALTKFFATNDNLGHTEDLLRRIFFEFLRSKPTLTAEQAENLETVSDLLSAIFRNPIP